MGGLSPIHWIVVLAVVVLFFGARRIPEVMRGFGEGIRSFKEGMRGDRPGTSQASTPARPANTAPSASYLPEKK